MDRNELSIEMDKLRKAYPKGTDSGLLRLAEITLRIGSRINVCDEERKEKSLALSWCRSNGNPHKANI